MYPYAKTSSTVLTTAGVYVLATRGNNPFGCWTWLRLAPLVGAAAWELHWAPVAHFVGAKVESAIIGDDNCATRFLKDYSLCKDMSTPQPNLPPPRVI